MNWPNHTDYQDSIQNPQFSFSEPELKTAEVACDMLGLPKVMSGNFASVYEVKAGDQKWAIRCFVRQVSGQQARYTILSKHLAAVQLPYLVKFDYISKGINVRNEWYPIVKMQWVTGVPLHVFVDEYYRDAAMLGRLASQWRELLQGIKGHHIAHGDLQHGNVMVTPEGDFRLVDYDGMYVPGFGRGRSPELGHVNYQHPRRTADYYEEALDNFAALVIQTCFLALAREPELWGQFSTGDNLLFVGADFQNPQKSKIFERLKASPDSQVKLLASLLEWCCLRPIATVPDFLETMKAVDEGKLPVDLSAATVVAPTATPNWMAEEAPPQNQPTGSRVAPAAQQGTRSAPSGGTRVAEEAKPVTTSAWSGSRPAEEPVVVPPRPSGVATDSPAGLNLFTLAAIALALLAFIPQLRLIAGAGALISGLAGLVKATSADSGSKWVGLGAGLLGAGLAIWGVLDMKSHGPRVEGQSSEEVAEVTPSAPPPSSPPPAPGIPVRPAAASVPAAAQAPTTETAKPAALPDLKVRPIGVLKAHSKSVDSLAFSHDSQTLASGSADGTVRLWDAQSGELRHTLNGIADGVSSMTFAPNNQSLFVVGFDNVVTEWDVASGKLKRTIKDYQKTIWPVAVSPDGTLLATGSGNRKMVKLVELAGGGARSSFSEQASWIKSVDFSASGKLVASQSFDDTVRLWDSSTAQARQSFSVTSNTVNRVVVSGNELMAATAIDSKDVAIWEIATAKLVQRLVGHLSEVKSLCFPPGNRFLVSGSEDRTIRFWDLTKGASRLSLGGGEGAVMSLAFSSDGKALASGGSDKMVRLWDSSSVR